jgi:soluble lytic murein transglycosylase
VPEVRSLEAMQMVYPQEYQKEIFEQAQKQKLNPLLVKSLIRQESAFGQKAVSTSNAYGLMQMIGPTAQEVAEELKINGLEIPNDLFQPAINIRMGTYYIAKVIRQLGGHVPLGLAAYNAGPHKVISFLRMRPELLTLPRSVSGDFKDEIWFDELPWSETSFYVKAILRNVLVYKMLEKSNGGVSSSIKLDQVLWSDLVLPM